MELIKDFIKDDIIFTNFINLSNEQKDLVLTWRNDDKIRNKMINKHIIKKEEHYNFIKKLKTDNKNIYWLVSKKNNSNIENIGVVSLNKIDYENKNAYWGIYLNPNIFGKSQYGLIIEYLILDIVFYDLNFEKLKGEVIIENQKLIKLHKFFGFEEIEIKDNLIFIEIYKDVWLKEKFKIKE